MADARERNIDMARLKGLAHPLRVQILDALTTYGPMTASGLGERLGESSGATSYHLRQLEKHGFVQDVPDKGTARERWWRSAPGSISIDPTAFERGTPERLATEVIESEWDRARDAALQQFRRHGEDAFPREWSEASMFGMYNSRMTLEQFAEFTTDLNAWMSERAARYPKQDLVPGSRPVQVQLNAFPLVGGNVVAEES